jgi:hypothetical protein
VPRSHNSSSSQVSPSDAIPAALSALSQTLMPAVTCALSGRQACAIVRTTFTWFSPAVMCASTGSPSFTRAWSLSTMICAQHA